MSAAPELDLSEPRRLHIVGVGGVGMSAIALLLVRMGHEVSGSDLKDSIALARLVAAGVKVAVGNRAENVPSDADAVVYSTAIPARNVELVAEREMGVAVLHRSAALAALARTRRTIAVAGSHGKTTTSSMLALMLRSAGWQPSFVIGGEGNEVGANAAYGEGEPPRLLRRISRAHCRVRALRRRRARTGRCVRRRCDRGTDRRRASRRAHLRLRSERLLPHRRRDPRG